MRRGINPIYAGFTVKQYRIAVAIDIICVGLLAILLYTITNKSMVIDPIKSIKDTFIHSQFIAISISTVSICVLCFALKDKQKLIKSLKIVFILSLIAIIVFLVIRIRLDSIYTENKFAQLYEISNNDKNKETDSKIHISVNLNGIKIVNEKENFITENIKAYNYFKTKTFLETIIYLIVISFNLIFIMRITNKKDKLEKLNSNFDILFDNEQNVKY